MLSVTEMNGANIIVVCESGEEAKLLAEFLRYADSNLRRARASGALSGEESLTLVYKAVLRICAERTSPFSDEGRELLANLRHFI